ncbi:hypothetical protein JOF56_001680 [Kibdelosporangium banguiense]|uniref:DUF1707 domain-containing protein n=1 Tax=Kibdelosporangium banguiense TaxID=1365924 RepID=A0ABS4TA47_9PSEU|nr:hypothetical protein [Kibdelosporangium banguiense]MBP2321295.1 hypothetical protein [Kibdelosporangium banguiense]
MITRKLDPWQEALLRELRTRDLSADRIEELLNAVDAHCADTGKSPQEAFGDPVVYAHIFAPGLQPVKFVPAAIQGIFGIAGLVILAAGVLAVMNDSPAYIRSGAIVSFAAATSVFIIFLALKRHLAISASALFLGAAALVVPYFLWPTVVAELPVWPAVTGGMFLVSVSWSVSVYPDHVVDPRANKRQILAMRWAMPAMMACAVLLSWSR